MSYPFIEAMALEPEEKEVLRTLAARGSDNPFQLMALYKAAPDEFASQFRRKDRVAAVTEQLERMLTDSERVLLAEEPPQFGTGAILRDTD